MPQIHTHTLFLLSPPALVFAHGQSLVRDSLERANEVADMVK